MVRRLLKGFTFANVCSFLALTIALGTGTAYAANTVFSTDIVDGEVKTADLANNGVTTAKITNNQVYSGDVRDDTLGIGGLTSVDLAADSSREQRALRLTRSVRPRSQTARSTPVRSSTTPCSTRPRPGRRSPEILDGAVANADLASNAVTGSKVAANSLTTADIAGADVNGGGTFSVPTGYVPNGRCRQLDAYVGGATEGEAVVFSIKAALQDGIVIYGQRVPSDSHVMFDVCNFSGTTQAQISDLPLRVITFG